VRRVCSLFPFRPDATGKTREENRRGRDNIRTDPGTTNPAGLVVAFTYNGSAAVPSDAGTCTVVATINDHNYQGNVAGTMTISTASQAESVPALGIWGIMATAAILTGYVSQRRRRR
jgi:hypothetical protein